jgi:dihydrofolate reductase
MMMTYDGRLADAKNGLDWMTNPAMDGDAALVNEWDAAVIGYGGYQGMAAYWPTAATDDPNISSVDKEFAQKINSMKKYVFASKERELGWNNSELVLVSGDSSIVDAVTTLKQKPGKDIVLFGGIRIAQTFARLDLIDEYMAVIHPVIIGSGKRLFEDTDHALKLKLVNVNHNKDAAVRIHYQRYK